MLASTVTKAPRRVAIVLLVDADEAHAVTCAGRGDRRREAA